jgi:hypothetical protein
MIAVDTHGPAFLMLSICVYFVQTFLKRKRLGVCSSVIYFLYLNYKGARGSVVVKVMLQAGRSWV